MDLIDRTELARRLATQAPEKYSGLVAHIISTAPTIEAEPTKHGRWEIIYYDNEPKFAYCSECNQKLIFTRDFERTPNYCPNCGCRMDDTPTEKVDTPTGNTNRPTGEVEE